MFRGFNLKDNHDFQNYFEAGNNLYVDFKNQANTDLKNYLSKDGTLNGTEMQTDWFPEIEADIFISHSHADEKSAIAFAGWLYTKFKLKSFIDSCIWGNAYRLLLEIDKEYCMQDDGYYNYSNRNKSTSLVHMMLSTALGKMIDKTECLIFLNSPNSITTSEAIQNRTKSPWIYSEIEFSRLVRKKPHRHENMLKSRMFSKGGMMNEDVSMTFDLEMNHLAEIDNQDLNIWLMTHSRREGKHPLDILYAQNPIDNFLL